MTLTALLAQYNSFFSGLIIKPEKINEVDTVVAKINVGKPIYQSIQVQTGVPWFFIGILHYMEANCNFTKHLHNGDPLSARTTHEPAGRPVSGKPPFTFTESALDAIKYKKLDKVTDWSVGNMLNLLEQYNGLGYRNMGKVSPYLWSYSQYYVKGKYNADSVYDPNLVSKQAGAAVIMYRVMQKNNILAQYIKTAAISAGVLLIAAAAAFFF